MTDAFTPEPAAAWLSSRLQQARHELARQWRAAVPEWADEPSSAAVAELIGAIASSLLLPPDRDVDTDRTVRPLAEELGRRRFTQGATVGQLLCECHRLADLVEGVLGEEARPTDPPFAAGDAVRAMRRVTESVRALQQRAVDAFVRNYTSTLFRQSKQLTAVGRLVAHEMRQPLGVLQLMAGVFPVREGDLEAVRLLDVFDRNVRRLADVAGRLERLSHDGLEHAPVTSELVDLGELVADVARKLGDMAKDRAVRVQVGAGLPTLRVDPARTEMVFVALIANAIKYSDPDKPDRVVEIVNVSDQPQPTVIVRDNGIGMPRRRVQHFFREFSRAHAHRERDLRDQGFGLGLSIVRESMDACGGTVLLQSTEGTGTTITLSWPRRATPAAR